MTRTVDGFVLDWTGQDWTVLNCADIYHIVTARKKNSWLA